MDELAKFRNPQEVWDQLNLALRIGKNPQCIITTTPKPIKLIQELLSPESKGQVYVTRGSTFENKQNLSTAFIDYVKTKYTGTNIGKQELDGEILTENYGSLWSHSLINDIKIGQDKLPDLSRIIIAIDPAVTNKYKQ